MRKTLLMSALLSAAVAMPVLAQTATDTGARPGHEPGVGGSEPSSTRASNINASGRHSTIAPRLPGSEQAAAGGMGPIGYLHQADRDLQANRTGAAQEALERAETGFLNNPVDPAAPGGPVGSPMASQASQARDALGRGDTAGARRLVQQALSQTSSGGAGSAGPMGSFGGADGTSGMPPMGTMPRAGGATGSGSGY